MSQQNKTTLQQSINTQLADNSSGEISAADIRSNMINATDSLIFNNGDQGITGSIELTGAVTASMISGSFVGDGSNLTNVTAEWDGSHNGDGNITGSLTISGTSNDITIEDGKLNFGTQEAISQTSLPSGDAIVVAGAVYVDSSQNVGIGTVNINHTLEVGGTVNITSDLKVTGSTILNDTTGSSFTGSFIGDGSGLTGITPTIADGSITNIKLTNDSVTLGSTEVDLGTTATTLAGVTLTGVEATGSFTGSFIGDGSGLTNLPASSTFPYTGTAEITGSLDISGTLYTRGASPATEFFSTAYTSNRIVSTWIDLGGINTQTEIDAGNITITSDFTDYITLRNNGTVKGLSRENGLRSTRLAFETGTITTDGVVTVPKDVTGTLALELKGYTVATLPTGTVGDRAYVTDATAPTYLGTLTGGGAVTSPVFHNGTSWVSG